MPTKSAPFPNNLYYAADISRRAYISNYYTDGGLRLTWQATKRNQFTENFIQEKNCNCFYHDESGQYWRRKPPPTTITAQLARAGHMDLPGQQQARLVGRFHGRAREPINADESGNTPTSIAVTDTSANFIYGAPGTGLMPVHPWSQDFININENFTASYVTGAHAFKFGYSELQARGHAQRSFPTLRPLTASPRRDTADAVPDNYDYGRRAVSRQSAQRGRVANHSVPDQRQE